MLIKDLLYAVRTLRKAPGFTLAAVITIALGIGASTAIFSLLDALLLRPLPVARPNELVRLVQLAAPLGARSYFTYTTYRELAQRAKSFTTVIAYHEAIRAVRDASGARNVPCQIVSGNFFSALGVHPLYGRALTPSDDLHASDVLPAVLSYAFWARNYASDPAAIGKRLTLQNRAFTVVGVMPREFHGVQLETAPDVFIPLIAADSLFTNPDFNSYSKLDYSLVARLRSGITLAVAQAEAESIFKAALDQEFHGSQEARYWTNGQFQLQPIANGVSLLRPKFSSALLLLMGGGVLLLLIVCANIGGLLLARTAAPPRRDRNLAGHRSYRQASGPAVVDGNSVAVICGRAPRCRCGWRSHTSARSRPPADTRLERDARHSFARPDARRAPARFLISALPRFRAAGRSAVRHPDYAA